MVLAILVLACIPKGGLYRQSTDKFLMDSKTYEHCRLNNMQWQQLQGSPQRTEENNMDILQINNHEMPIWEQMTPKVFVHVWHCVEHPVLWVYHCCITHVFLWPFCAILGGHALDMVHPKHIILFADVMSLNDAVMSYVMSQHHNVLVM